MSANEWTDEELAALPQTTMVFDAPKIDLNEHDLVQEGYTVIDRCSAHPTISFGIPTGKLLIKEGGKYRLVDEVTRK